MMRGGDYVDLAALLYGMRMQLRWAASLDNMRMQLRWAASLDGMRMQLYWAARGCPSCTLALVYPSLT